jgi:hypothetical protein
VTIKPILFIAIYGTGKLSIWCCNFCVQQWTNCSRCEKQDCFKGWQWQATQNRTSIQTKDSILSAEKTGRISSNGPRQASQFRRRGGYNDAQNDVSSIESYRIYNGTTENGRNNFGSALHAIGRWVAPIVGLMTKRSRVQLAPKQGEREGEANASLRQTQFTEH